MTPRVWLASDEELDADEQDEGLVGFYRGLGFSTEPKPPGRNLFLAREL
jgi:hypothetical protein